VNKVKLAACLLLRNHPDRLHTNHSHPLQKRRKSINNINNSNSRYKSSILMRTGSVIKKLQRQLPKTRFDCCSWALIFLKNGGAEKTHYLYRTCGLESASVGPWTNDFSSSFFYTGHIVPSEQNKVIDDVRTCTDRYF